MDALLQPHDAAAGDAVGVGDAEARGTNAEAGSEPVDGAGRGRVCAERRVDPPAVREQLRSAGGAGSRRAVAAEGRARGGRGDDGGRDRNRADDDRPDSSNPLHRAQPFTNRSLAPAFRRRPGGGRTRPGEVRARPPAALRRRDRGGDLGRDRRGVRGRDPRPHEPTFCVARTPLRARDRRRARAGLATEYEVALDGERRWPEPDSEFPPSVIRTLGGEGPLRLAFGSCRVSLPHHGPYVLPKERARRRARVRRPLHAGRGDAAVRAASTGRRRC